MTAARPRSGCSVSRKALPAGWRYRLLLPGGSSSAKTLVPGAAPRHTLWRGVRRTARAAANGATVVSYEGRQAFAAL
jgi:hypothetical protein